MNYATAAILAFALSFAVVAALGPAFIRYLRQMKFGQKILEIGPKWHMSKQYTPTMGGILFIGSTALAVLISLFTSRESGDFRHLAVLGFALLFAAIGFVDDYTKIKNKRNMGLTPLQKILLQTLAAVIFLAALRLWGYLTPNLYIPFYDVTYPMRWMVFMPFAAFVIVGAVNAVNLTDGVDGLATGVTLPISLFFCIVALLSESRSMLILTSALTGGLVGFLIFNFNPAKVFMGDTGALFLGGMVSGFAFAFDMPMILIFVGAVYIAETLSDILQVGYFKLSGGRRLFKMAPLHHHLEMRGWNEKKIVYVFTAITAVLCIVAYFGVSGRYSM